MEGKVYVITDETTCALFRLMGAAVVKSNDPDETLRKLKELLGREDAAVVLVSYDVAYGKEDEIREIASKVPRPVISLIPGRKFKPPKLDPNEVLMKALGFG
ncbi:V-type ATP synthase subunit F [Ignicoccus islandicus]|nr:V-type ATP synthase subunit F [Ignicoccus islandicus]